jgi:hypothetical protein
MEFFDYVKFLGMYWGEQGLQPLVEALSISKPPKIPKAERDAYLLLKKMGVELIFTDERFVKIPDKVFPEGAMVLCNATFYLTNRDGYKPYAGKLPKSMKLEETKTEMLKAFGIPNFPKYSPSGKLLPDEDDWKMRWDRPDHVLFCTFNDDGTATDIGLQLPLDQA